MSGPPRKAAPKPPTMAIAEPVLCKARVSHPYQADSDKELTLIEGETIEVLQQDGDWWRGKGTSGMGWFPKDYVEEATSGMMMGGFGPDGGNLMGVKPPAKTTAQERLKQLSDQVVGGLKQLYKDHIKPVEALYKFGEFHSPMLEDSDFDAPPMVLMLGQYSVGKTSFIRYLLERDFPGQRIGPEPTTDRFVAVMNGKAEKVTPGNAAAMDSSRPFRALNRFGSGFLSKFEVLYILFK